MIKQILLFGMALTVVLAAVAIQRSQKNSAPVWAPTDGQVFEVKGQIRGIETDENTIHIAHEDIPGFMPAMTMPFTMRDPALLRGLAAGDAVKFQLVVTRDDSWITRIEKLNSMPATRTRTPADAKEILRIGLHFDESAGTRV